MQQALHKAYSFYKSFRTIALPITNILLFIVQASVNGAGSTGSFGKGGVGQISDRNATEIVPAGYAFSIWGVIYALQVVFLLVQVPFLCLGRSPRQVRILGMVGGDNYLIFERIGWLFPLSCVLNLVWIIVFVYEALWPSLVIIVTLTALVAVMYFRVGVHYGDQLRQVPHEAPELLQQQQPQQIDEQQESKRSSLSGNKSQVTRSITTWEYWAVQTHLSIYLGWLTCASFLNLFITWKYGTSPSVAQAGWTEQNWSVLCQTIAALFAIGLAVWRQDFIYSGTVSWALYAIGVKHLNDTYESVRTTAFVLASICAIASLVSLLHVIRVKLERTIDHCKQQRNSKQAPIVEIV